MDNIKEITKRTYNQIAKDYVARDRLVIAETREVRESLKQFASLLPQDAKVLDVGIGGSRDAKEFVKCGCEVVGIDVAEKLMKEGQDCADISGITYMVMDVEELDFSNEFFDGVWANASLHHLEKTSLPKVLAKLFDVLRDNGYLQIKVKKGKREGIVTEHQYNRVVKRYFARYEIKELERYVRAAGFQIVYAKSATHDEWVDLLARKAR